MSTITKVKARMTTQGRDLFWSLMTHCGEVMWTGYNDVYWWRNVAMDDGFRVQMRAGHRYTLNPSSNEVLIEVVG